MTKIVVIVFLFITVSTGIYPDTGPSPDFGPEKSALGISGPKDTEAEAVLEAKNSALHDLAASIASYVISRFDVKVRAGGTNPQEVIFVTEGDASVMVRLPLTGIREVERKVEWHGGKYIVRIRIAISAEGITRAVEYTEREAAAFRAYHFFSQRVSGFTGTSPGASGADYPDYHTWLEHNCLIMAFREKIQDPYLDQLDLFLRKLYRDICIFSGRIDGRPVRIIYNAPKYMDYIVTALQKNGFIVFRENSHLLLKATTSQDEFSAITQNMADAGTVIFTGIHFGPGQRRKINMDASLLKELNRMAQTEFGMNAIVFSLPEDILKGNYTEEELFHRISGYTGTARYIALIILTSTPEPTIPAYGIPESFRLSYVCTLFDMLTEHKTYTRTVYDIGFPSPSATSKWEVFDFPIGKSIPAALLEAVKNIMTDL